MLPVPAAGDTNPPSADYCKKQADKNATSRATTELRDYPGKVVAGSGWRSFTLRAAAKPDQKERLESTCLHVDIARSSVSDPASTDSTEFVTLEWFDPAEGKGWQKVANSRDDSTYFARVANLAPGEHFDVKLRLKVDDKAKAGNASTYHGGIFVGQDGVCGKTETKNSAKNPKTFEILPVGTKLDETNHSNSPSPSASQSNGAKSSASPSPSSSVKASSSASPSASASASASASTGTTGTTTTGGGTTTSGSGGSTSAQGSLSNTSVDGQLAKTGSSSSTPVIAGLAGAAVVAGGAAVAVARRRKNNA
ncbi:LAETG motif-containing sortase-dependent surface protein [Streptomyces albireticuli]|uniref:LAETG motif-containing sortase-dependent surface protein n=1 Tax=Streptomyces albireticuli TaxID=1940 RepID=UPI001E42628C|nr:LAETG motif-containing sortase-dependent surface protein [Streptomyces albireticuli]MCD9142870.1 LPXTG cell wall anchor domain-containing protein [Streptomyces albireticuli]MCD9162811.1 LPXTG cell wall anchor domain-containing protein [Streptomyces albireticuli]MCD9192371.1 LPXTG cell wall anchor domain-containing protein [Streptomyces albireticuli]